MTKYFLGFDVGGTKTAALVADDTGQALGYGRSGCGNWETVGYHGFGLALQESAWGLAVTTGSASARRTWAPSAHSA